MAEKTYMHELYPDTTIIVALFRDVENAKAVKEAVTTGKLDICSLKASLVLDEFLVTLAANKAVHSERIGKLITKTVHNEILFNLASTKKIGDALAKFGISDNETSILFVIAADEEQAKARLQKLQSLIKGRPASLHELASLADMNAIKKEYKLSEDELAACTCIGAIASRIAVKGIVAV